MNETSWSFYLTALGTGLLFGYATQRGGFCLTRALSNLFIMGEATILRAYLLALLVATVGTHLLMTTGMVEIPIRPFHWLSNLVGGFVFGIGMILSGGCSGSTNPAFLVIWTVCAAICGRRWKKFYAMGFGRRTVPRFNPA